MNQYEGCELCNQQGMIELDRSGGTTFKIIIPKSPGQGAITMPLPDYVKNDKRSQREWLV